MKPKGRSEHKFDFGSGTSSNPYQYSEMKNARVTSMRWSNYVDATGGAQYANPFTTFGSVAADNREASFRNSTE